MSPVAVAARFLWDLGARMWFWITNAVAVLLHVPLIILIPWRASSFLIVLFCRRFKKGVFQPFVVAVAFPFLIAAIPVLAH